MKKPLALLLDTNIWLDYYDPLRPRAGAAFALIDTCINADIQLLYAATTLKDVFYQVGAIGKRELLAECGTITAGQAGAVNEMAWGCIQRTRDIAASVPVTDPILAGAFALKKVHSDFADDVILAAAEMAHVDFLVTNDRKLLTKGIVPVLSAEDMLTYIQAL